MKKKARIIISRAWSRDFFIAGLILLSLLTGARAEQPLEKDKEPAKPVDRAKEDNPPAPPSPKRVTINGVTVTFTGPSEAVVEVNGQVVKIDTALQSALPSDVTNHSTTTEAASAAPAPANPIEEKTAPAKEAKTEKTADQVDPETYYGYELINVPTPRTYEKYALSVHFTHRFSQSPFFKSANQLFGLDSFSSSGLGFSFGITDRLYAKVYRTPVSRTIEIGGGFHLLHQGENMPISAQIYSSVEGQDNFNEHFIANIVGMVGHSFSRYGSVFFAPTISFNTNPLTGPNIGPNNTGSFGFGGQYNFRPTASLLIEATPRSGYLAPGSVSEVAFGIQKRTYRHVFTLTLSNTQGTTTSQYNVGFGSITDRKMFSRGLVIGFNIWRRLY
jgi:hypothetical protein